MLRGVFRTKERKIITAILVIILIISAVFAYMKYEEKNKYVEQTVMAEKYRVEGNYKQAVEAYIKALSMKNSDEELLSIGLAEAYIGVNDYDKALEVLRSCYQNTSGVNIKEKIEDVTSRKTDYEYLQIISRADIYFSNEEYDKAIAEYEKAKLIKSKEVISFQRISEAYIKIGNYNLAREEVLEGLALTQSGELESMLDEVDEYLLRQQYDMVITEAAEYIYQENYEDGIKKYEEAIKLLPKEEQAYSALAATYISMEEYQKAVTLLQGVLVQVKSDELEGLLEEAFEMITAIKVREKILSDLYEAIDEVDTNKIMELLSTDIFKEKIVAKTPVYYNPVGEGNLVNGHGLIIYDSEHIYYGEIRERMKKGSGLYFMLSSKIDVQGYYYYQGEWNHDIPNGTGKTVEETTLLNAEGKLTSSTTVTEGVFSNGTENGSMHKYFYTDGKETGNVTYVAKNGKPVAITEDNGLPILAEEGKPYAIGKLFLGENWGGEYYYVEPITSWGVKPFILVNN